MRTIPALFATLAACGLVAGLGSAAGAHPGIDLRTYANGEALGEPVAAHLDDSDTLSANGDPKALVAGPPVSPKQSCNLCHSYQAINKAYHFQLGLDERIDIDNDGFKDDLGQYLVTGLHGEGGVLKGLPTLYNITSPGQFGAW